MERQDGNTEPKQFNIELFDDVQEEVEEVLSRVPGLSKKILGNVALREKARKLIRRLDAGKEVPILR